MKGKYYHVSLSIENSISIGDVSPRFRLPVPPVMLTADLCRICLSMSIRCVIKTGGKLTIAGESLRCRFPSSAFGRGRVICSSTQSPLVAA